MKVSSSNFYSFEGLPSDWIKNEKYDLKCFYHRSGYFLVYYLMNRENYLLELYGSETSKFQSVEKVKFDSTVEEMYDFKLKNRETKLDGQRNADSDTENGGTYPFMALVKRQNKLQIIGARFNFLKSKTGPQSITSSKDLLDIKKYTQGYFHNYHFNNSFFYFTYNDVYDFQSGYYKNPNDCDSGNDVSGSYHDLSNVNPVKNAKSPFEFEDEVEIIDMNIMYNNNFVYYKILNKVTQKYYHGIYDIKSDQIVWHTDKTVKLFTPYIQIKYTTTANYEYADSMLVITEDEKAYRVCGIKDGSNCVLDCPGKKVVVDIDGTTCQSTSYSCSGTKVTLLPEKICIPKTQCNTTIYKMTDTYCGLCRDMESPKIYRFIGSSNCIKDIPDEGVVFYNKNLSLLTCDKGYKLENDNCVPNCFERCDRCYDFSSDVNDQKCKECIEGYILSENNNCERIKTTIPTTIPTTVFTTIITTIPTTILTTIPTTFLTTIPTTILTTIPTTITTTIPTTITTTIPTTITTTIPTTITTTIPTTITTTIPTTITTTIPTTITTTIPTTITTTIPTTIITTIPTTIITTTPTTILTTIPTTSLTTIPTTIFTTIPTTIITTIPTTIITTVPTTTLTTIPSTILTSIITTIPTTILTTIPTTTITTIPTTFITTIPTTLITTIPTTTITTIPSTITTTIPTTFITTIPTSIITTIPTTSLTTIPTTYINIIPTTSLTTIVTIIPTTTIPSTIIEKKCEWGILVNYTSSYSNLTSENVYESKLKSIIDSYYIYGSSVIVDAEDGKFQITTTRNEIKDDGNDKSLSKLDLTDCEKILKKEYDIDEDVELIILQFFREDSTFQYEVYNPLNHKKLNLSYCENTTLDVYVPFEMSEKAEEIYSNLKEQGYDPLDLNDKFYREICTPYTSENGTDVLLDDREEFIYTSLVNESVCPSGCNYSEYMMDKKYIKCECDTNTTGIETLNLEHLTGKNIGNSFLSTLQTTNWKVMRCYNLVFNFNIFVHNYGSILILILFVIYILFMIYYSFREITPLKVEVSKIVFKELEKESEKEKEKKIIKYFDKKPKEKNKNKAYAPPKKLSINPIIKMELNY